MCLCVGVYGRYVHYSTVYGQEGEFLGLVGEFHGAVLESLTTE